MLSAMFFGAVVNVPKVDLALKPLPAEVTSESIAQFWEQISAAQTKDVLAALHRQRDLMSLGDWAFAQMAYNTALPLAKGDATLARLIAWHFLVKSGYAARVGFSGDRVHVLLKASELVYGVSFFTFGSDRFYVLDLSGGLPPFVGSIRTYDKDHPDAKKSIAFQMAMLPVLVDEPMARTLRFAYKDRKFEFPVTVNRNLVRFLTNYPQTQLPGYLNPEIDSPAMDELVSALRPIIAGRSEVESVDLVLRFVQTAFDYQTDKEQFDREKWLFPEETLYYPYSDCEDRSILFAYLTRRLVPSVSIVGLIYSNHIATAIKFSTAVQGDVRMHRGERYVVSDPTYINASVGMEMPQYKDASPTIVEARALQRR